METCFLQHDENSVNTSVFATCWPQNTVNTMILATNGEQHYKYRDIWPARRQKKRYLIYNYFFCLENLQTCHKHSQTDAFWGPPRVTANDSKHLRFYFFIFFLGGCQCADAFCIDTLLQINDVTRSNFYTERLLCAHAVTQRGLCTETLLQRGLYTQRFSCKETFTHRKFYTDALHKDTFAPCSIDAQTLLHADAFTHRRLSGTDIFLHRNLGSFLQNGIFPSLNINICTPAFEL